MPKKKKKFPLIKVKCVGSSHFTERHGLPRHLTSYMESDQNSRYVRNVDFDGVGGRLMDINMVELVKEKMDVSVAREEPCVIVLMIGSNNIRRRGLATDIFHYFEQLVMYASKLQRIHLILCGMLPSPETDEFSKENFQEASRMLQDLSKSNSTKVSFLNVAELFTYNKEIKNHLYSDGIHLTTGVDGGAHLLAKHIFIMLKSLAKSKLSYN